MQWDNKIDELSFPKLHLMKKGDISDFVWAMVVDARQTSLSISETADPLRFSCWTVSRV